MTPKEPKERAEVKRKETRGKEHFAYFKALASIVTLLGRKQKETETRSQKGGD